MKLTKVTITNENGEEGILERKEYLDYAVKTHEVKDHESEEQGKTPAKNVVNHILKSFEDGKEPEEVIANAYPELVSAIKEDYDRTVKGKEDAKAKAEEEKAAKKVAAEQAKKEAEAKKEALIATQGEFAMQVGSGAELASSEFKDEVKALAEALPEGASVIGSDGHYAIKFDEKADKSVIAQTLGYLMQKQQNSGFIANQLQFWIGDTITAAVAKGIYATAKEAQEHIAKTLEESSGKKFEALSLAQYKRMADRTPVELRNPRVDPTAYLAISSAARPKKGEKETDEQFKTRLESFDKDVLDVQGKLASGELTKRKEIVPIMNELLIKHGMKEKEDDTPKISATQQAMIFFHATFAIENLADTHEKGMVSYKEGETIHHIPVSEMEAKRDEAFANLLNIFYTSEKAGLKPADYIRGYVEETKDIVVGKNPDGTNLVEPETTQVKVYPVPFFEVPKTEETK